MQYHYNTLSMSPPKNKTIIQKLMDLLATDVLGGSLKKISTTVCNGTLSSDIGEREGWIQHQRQLMNGRYDN